MLEVRNLTCSFGGVKALQDVSFTIRQGTIHSVIGPNGAGKTTLFNLITGVYTPSAGDIVFDGASIVGRAPDELARRGMSRTFQNMQICMNMSALENLMVGAHLRLQQGLLAGMARLPSLRRAERACRDECAALMNFVGVGRYVDAHATQMSYGALKRLEIGRALAAKPKLLLLDEPAAGLNHSETQEIDELIQKVAATGVTVVLVEHDMKLVMNISDHILVLDYGKKLAEGTAQQVRANPDVIAAYLGAGGHGLRKPVHTAAVPATRTATAGPAAPVLEIHGLTSHYGRIQALHGLDIEVREGQLVALVGANGAGKTTLLRTVSGVQPASGGEIRFQGRAITRLAAEKRVRAGICQVPEGRQVLGPLSVEDNIRLGAYTRKDVEVDTDMERMYALFPILGEKRRLAAGTLSGGQQQMLAIARALMGRPRLLLLDEPSMGLAPLLVEEIFHVVQRLKAEGITIFLVEQHAHAALSIADVGHVMEMGRITLSGSGADLLGNDEVQRAYLGM
jgi:ABC-type branched-subunit amino acid transport system ATPase component